MLTLLTGHTTPGTAHTANNRVWVERAERGPHKGQERTMTQGGDNEPIPGNYWNRVFLYTDERDNRMHVWPLDLNGPADYARFVASGLFSQLSESEQSSVLVQVAFDRRFSPRTWSLFFNIKERLQFLMSAGGPFPTLEAAYALGSFYEPLQPAKNPDDEGKAGGVYRSDFETAYLAFKAESGNGLTTPALDDE